MAVAVDIVDAFKIAFMAHYVFDLQYNKHVKNVLTFIQKGLYSVSDGISVPATVRTLLNLI